MCEAIKVDDGVVAWRLQKEPSNILLYSLVVSTALLQRLRASASLRIAAQVIREQPPFGFGYNGTKPTVGLHGIGDGMHLIDPYLNCVRPTARGRFSRRESVRAEIACELGRLGSDDDFDFEFQGKRTSTNSAHVSILDSSLQLMSSAESYILVM